jgi:transposase-like protein
MPSNGEGPLPVFAEANLDPPADPRAPGGDTPSAASRAGERAARLAKFEREQLIVDYLNRGVSIAEIAARIGVGEKRMRAIIREILARRAPAPPEEFVAIQVSRLNEALLVAFSAMTDMNLRAVDRVVRIVRELDRYHGFAAVEKRVPETPRVEALPGARTRPATVDPEGAGQMGSDRRSQFPFSSLHWDDLLPVDGDKGASAAPADDERPENRLQDLENLESAPGTAAAPEAEGAPGDLASRGSQEARHNPPGADSVADAGPVDGLDRPEIPPQGLEQVESAPGVSPGRERPAARARRKRGAASPWSPRSKRGRRASRPHHAKQPSSVPPFRASRLKRSLKAPLGIRRPVNSPTSSAPARAGRRPSCP